MSSPRPTGRVQQQPVESEDASEAASFVVTPKTVPSSISRSVYTNETGYSDPEPWSTGDNKADGALSTSEVGSPDPRHASVSPQLQRVGLGDDHADDPKYDYYMNRGSAQTDIEALKDIIPDPTTFSQPPLISP